MFHLRNGLFFERLQGGHVRIIKTYDERDVRPDNVVLDITVPENEWTSVVCSVSKAGETLERWKEARQFHGTEFSELQPSGEGEEPKCGR